MKGNGSGFDVESTCFVRLIVMLHSSYQVQNEKVLRLKRFKLWRAIVSLKHIDKPLKLNDETKIN
jgi:hypothetical protein